ncbi:MAG: glycosyltransferase [Bacteroidota bacterium]
MLYRELASYMVNCLNKLQNEVEITVMHYPLNAEAPFIFNWNNNIICLEKNSNTLESLNLNEFHAIFVSGWADKEYLKLTQKFKGIKILMFDTPFENNLKFHLGSVYLKWKVKSLFQFAFVPGIAQVKLAKKIGFQEEEIKTGLYTASSEIQEKNIVLSDKKKLWCVSRYVPQKNLLLLWNCFNLSNGKKMNWELHCAGTGEGWENRTCEDGIFHHGFLQPTDLNLELNSASAFILPSSYEPWGVVVHECAKKSLPLILSTAVHSNSQFLKPGKNGYLFHPNSQEELINAMNTLFNKSEDELEAMGKISFELSQEITVENWIDHVKYFLTSGNVRN